MITKNIVTYIRTATKDDDAVSMQRTVLNEFVAEFDGTLGVVGSVTEIIDQGYSGLANNRPGFSEIKEKASNGEIDMLVVTDPMRLHRNVFELCKFMDEYAEDLGVVVVFCDQSTLLEEDGVDDE